MKSKEIRCVAVRRGFYGFALHLHSLLGDDVNSR